MGCGCVQEIASRLYQGLIPWGSKKKQFIASLDGGPDHNWKLQIHTLQTELLRWCIWILLLLSGESANQRCQSQSPSQELQGLEERLLRICHVIIVW